MKVAIEELSKVEIITKEAKVAELTKEFGKFGITGMTVYDAMGCGVQLGTQEYEAEKLSVLLRQNYPVQEQCETGSHLSYDKLHFRWRFSVMTGLNL